jgi:hypothetical protein
MNELVVVDKGADWRRLKALVLDSANHLAQARWIRMMTMKFLAVIASYETTLSRII